MESNKEVKCCNGSCAKNKGQGFKLPVPEKTCNYLQRLGISIDARLAVIDRLFTNHANDVNASVLDSVPFKKYHSEFEELTAEYAEAKAKFSEEIKPIVYEKFGDNVDFRWAINDFLAQEAEITIL